MRKSYLAPLSSLPDSSPLPTSHSFTPAHKTNTPSIFELQSRTLQSFLTIALLAPAALLFAPLYALQHRSLSALIFTYLIPIIPFVLVFDGWMSSLRTRTPAEVERKSVV